MGLSIDTNWSEKKTPETNVYATEEHKRECAQGFIDGSYIFKGALRDFRDLCKRYQIDFEDRAAFFADLVNREP